MSLPKIVVSSRPAGTRNVDIKINSNVVTNRVYDLPPTYFDGTHSIVTPYKLLLASSQVPSVEGALGEWTLFYKASKNTAISAQEDRKRLFHLFTPNVNTDEGADGIGYFLIGGVRAATTEYHLAENFIANGDETEPNWTKLGTKSEGCFAFRRPPTSVSRYIQWTEDGRTWSNTMVDQTSFIVLTNPSRNRLCFGGTQSAGYGIGTISATLWNKSLDDISYLFH